MSRHRIVGAAGVLIAVGQLGAMLVVLAQIKSKAGGIQPAHGRAIIATEIVLVDKQGVPRGNLFVSDEGRVGLTLLDSAAKPRLTLFADDKASGIQTWDQSGIERLKAVSTDKGSGYFLLDKYSTRASMITLPDGRSALALYDEGKNPVWTAP